ncbi:MAG: hypothetical protein RLZZ157_1583 [Pseudomonadota bacterium]|jgi:hypothetical protein
MGRVREDVRLAMNAARARAGAEGGLVGLSATGLLLAFVLLALLAPVQMRVPAWLATTLGFLVFVLIVGATGLGVVAIWRMVQSGARDGELAAPAGGALFSQSAIEAALSDAEDAGLRALAPRRASDALTGQMAGRPVVVVQADGVTYAVLRSKVAFAASLLVAPSGTPWPFALPKGPPLIPLAPPTGLAAQIWTNERAGGQALLSDLAPALAMSAAGGELPFLSARGRALVLMWRQGDVGTASVILAEIVKGLGFGAP